MKHYVSSKTRSGFTFLELLISVLATGILLVGLNSAMFVALKASDTSLTPARVTNEGLSRLNEMCAELQFALTVTELTATSITYTVPDRDDPDTNPETIRYAWSGTPGAPLTRQYNGGTATTVTSNVYSLVFDSLYSGSNVRYISVRLQIGADARSVVETGISLVNRP
ncbi:MAG: prepilin-type N-terminal cleavage/methylation domain-containing protein [Planctomycetota bacterium]|nr:prepilin-type N-terminal cleavage/methylation domain-containing protein [Planctomycetota bacterium]